MAIDILTPPGRIVWGHPLVKSKKTDPKTRKPILRDGKEIDVWAYGLAIPVANFQTVEQALAQAGYQQYPQGQFPRDFSWKIKRETDLDEHNKPYREREGYAGSVVLTISTEAFCPPAYKYENGVYRQLTEQEIKCGDWGVAKLSINSHPGGIYVNPVMFELVGYDKEIVRRNAANPNEMLGGRTYQLPPGVSTTPIGGAPSGVAAPQAYQPAPAGIPGGQPMSYQPSVMNVPPVMPAPAHDFVHNAGIPGGQPQPYQPSPPAPQNPAGIPPMAGIPVGR